LDGADIYAAVPPKHKNDEENEEEENLMKETHLAQFLGIFQKVFFKLNLKLSIITNILIILVVKVSLKIKTNLHLKQIKIRYQNNQDRLKHTKFLLSLI